MLANLVVLMLSSSDESEGDVAPSWILRRGASRVDPGHYGLPLDNDDEVETPTRVPEWDRSNTTGRGRHSREGAATRLSHADQAHAAWEAVQSSALAGACEASCQFRCEDRLQRDEMFTCIEYSYGTIEWVSAAALKVSKRQATIAYGKECVRDGEAGLRSMCEALNPWCHIASWVETERAQSRAHRSQQHGSGLVCPVPAPQSNLTLLSTRRRWTTTIKSGKTGVVIAAR